jgi:hypothetical protein
MEAENVDERAHPSREDGSSTNGDGSPGAVAALERPLSTTLAFFDADAYGRLVSYLDTPRLHFAGRFQADVSTVNNDPEHFDAGRFQASYQELASGADGGWWNPTGSGAWRFARCVVGQIDHRDGSSAPVAADPLLGSVLLANETGPPAKLVDLDPEQQMVSTIFGMRLALRSPDGRPLVEGSFVPAPFENIWVRFPAGRPDSFYSATYQSVITDLTWDSDIDAPVIEELRAAATGEALSIRFTVDGIDQTESSPTFTWGRVVGTIGPFKSGEPRHFVAARVMTAPPGQSVLNTAPFVLDSGDGWLTIDLGNSLPTSAPGGPPQDLGTIQIVTHDDGGDTVVLASLDTGQAAFNDMSAGVLSVQLSGAALEAALEHPLSVVDPTGTVQLAERDDGRYVRADEDVFRIYPVAPDETAATTLYATRFGARAQGAKITARMDNSVMEVQVVQGPLPGPPVGVPAKDHQSLGIGDPQPTNADGTTELVLTGHPPGNPRGYIDGQVYGVAYGWDGDAGTAAGNALSVHVYDAYDVPERPTWNDDVGPVLTQYANLYPVMRTIVDLGNFHSVRARWEMVDLALNLPIEHPNSMPVTRDLSPGKRRMLLDWLESADQPLFRTETVEDLRVLVQLAIELEHSTIPAYLYALFSIKPGANEEVAAILRSIVVEEMMHMALACNILNAIGGAPVIDRPGFVPSYPSALPASLGPGLVVSTRRCTIEHIRDVFMAIEEPSETITTIPHLDSSAITVGADGTPTGPVAAVAELVRDAYTSVEHHPFTIGWFYSEISTLLRRLSDGADIFTGDPARQITPQSWPQAPGRLYKVTNAETAYLAIHEIVEQGEGTSPDDPHGTGDELAHYFRFQEIVEGHRLVIQPDGTWRFDGDPIALDDDGVWPVIDDPQLVAYTDGATGNQADLFDATYAGLLAELHQVVNGAPQQLAGAVGTMFSLEVIAQRLMQLPVAEGSHRTAGPRFAQSSAPPPPADAPAGPAGKPAGKARTKTR